MRQKYNKEKKKSSWKNIGQTNKSNKIAKNCSLSSYKRSRSNKIIYMLVPLKNEIKKQ